MHITQDHLTIRNALLSDAAQLCTWWNDGAVMAHAGFPNGLGTTEQKVREQIEANTDNRRLIIELDGRPVGEMSYSRKDKNTAEIGIKICEANEQNRGIGTTLLRMFIRSLFEEYGFDRIILDTNTKNLRAQHVYEKLGFCRVGFRENCWKDQLGQWQSAIDYELTKKEGLHD